MTKLEFHTEKRRVSDLVPYKFNPRKLSDKAVEHLKASLLKFGLVEIPVVNTDGTIVAGHQRLKVMAMLGHGGQEIDVRVPNRPLTEEEVQEYNIRSNKNVGEWDFDMLANAFEMDELLDWGFEKFELGFDDAKKEIDVDTSAEAAEKFLGAGIKQIVLYFKAEQFDELVPQLNEIMVREGIENHSDLFLFLKKFYENTRA